MVCMFVNKDYILIVIILLSDYSSPRDFHLLGALKKNSGGHKFENICEVETVLIRCLITRTGTLTSGEYVGCTHDKMNASVAVGTMWKSNEIAVQLNFDCSYSSIVTQTVTIHLCSLPAVTSYLKFLTVSLCITSTASLPDWYFDLDRQSTTERGMRKSTRKPSLGLGKILFRLWVDQWLVMNCLWWHCRGCMDSYSCVKSIFLFRFVLLCVQ